MSEPLGVSIIVVNYNNESFLTAAIDSALGQNHPKCEIIVVDDCSTDKSRAIIAGYGDRIKSVLREANGGQTAALNSAWPLACHPILIFLDSDDLLLPHAAATFASHWSEEIVKIQGPVVTIDKAGRELGTLSPKFPPNLDTAMLRRALLRTGCSPLSNGSGSAFSRALMESIARDGGFDLSPREMWMEWILECNAPFYGKVLTIFEPQGCYRVHGSNLYYINSIDPARFARECRNFEMKLDYFVDRCEKWGVSFERDVARNSALWPLECRLISDKLSHIRDSLTEPVWRTSLRALKACINNEVAVSNRVIHAAWLVSVAVSPRALALRLVELRFLVTKRPAWVQKFITVIANITSCAPASRRRMVYR
jgi:glycosyltransferase involved in cell wall biosynthesis